MWIQHLQPNFILKPAGLITPYWYAVFCIFQCKFKIKIKVRKWDSYSPSSFWFRIFLSSGHLRVSALRPPTKHLALLRQGLESLACQQDPQDGNPPVQGRKGPTGLFPLLPSHLMPTRWAAWLTEPCFFFFFFENFIYCQAVVANTPLVPALWRKRQAGVYELKVSLIYRASLRTATKRNPVSQRPASPSLSQLGGQVCPANTHTCWVISTAKSNHASKLPLTRLPTRQRGSHSPLCSGSSHTS